MNTYFCRASALARHFIGSCDSAGIRNILYITLLSILAGCSSKSTLMPTPNLYAWGTFDPFKDVPPALQNNKVEVLYATDRLREGDTPTGPKYGYKRSRALAYGVSEVEIGHNLAWDELVKASRTKDRSANVDLTVAKTTELGMFPPTPRNLVELPSTMPAGEPTTTQADVIEEEKEKCKQLLSERLKISPVKEVYVFVHGYANTFDDAVITIAQLWHTFGRRGVPVAYTWPAGSSGLLRGYTYDSASSEFTVYHFKEMLRLIASVPEVEKIHIIGHSRGTDVVTSALRELHLEISGGGRVTREVMKLGTVVLAAPDLDLDVVIQRFVTAKLGRVPERFGLYVCSTDKALGFSNWLFSGMQRLGALRSDIFSPAELEALRSSKSFQIVDARVSDSGAFGHNYFHSNPAVSSDLILLMRYGLPPGAEFGRPLRIDKKGFWVIDDDYPGPPRNLDKETEGK